MNVVRNLRQDAPRPGRDALRVLTGSGQLGNGIAVAAFREGLARKPHVIGCDMGSVDPGPAYLGSGRMATSEAVTLRDLRLVIHGAREVGVPLIIGSAGTAGAAPHVERVLGMISAIAREDLLPLRVAVIHADTDRAWLKRQVAAGRVRSLGRAMPELTVAEIDASAHIVGQMGTEAFLRALALEPDIILAGRACDTAIFAAVPVMLGYPEGLATHMAKIIECSSLCCTPGGSDAILGTLHADAFDIESMNPVRAATPISVAAHGLYEQSNPHEVREPHGTLHLTDARFEALDHRRVRVSGARWVDAAQPSIKLEGSAPCGERAVTIAATCDPGVIAHRDAIAEGVRGAVADILPDASYDLHFRIYGAGATNLYTGARTGITEAGEAFVLIECIAPTADLAKAVVGVAKQKMLHFGFPGRRSTGGNLAFPFTPPELSAGTAYRFSVYHVAECDDLSAAFPVELVRLGP